MAVVTGSAYKSGSVSSALGLNTPRTITFGSLNGNIPSGAVIYKSELFYYMSTTSYSQSNNTYVSVSCGGQSWSFKPAFTSQTATGVWHNHVLVEKTTANPQLNVIIDPDDYPSVTLSDGSTTYIKNNSDFGYAACVYFYYYIPAEPTAPTSITFSKSRPAPGEQVSAYISGFDFGELNYGDTYELARSESQSGTYTTIDTGNTSTKTVTANATYNASYWYKARIKVRDRNNVAHYSDWSSAFQLQTKDRTAPTAPTVLKIDNQTAVSSISSTAGIAGSSHTLTWSGATAGEGNPVGKYEVYRSTTQNGTYTKLGDTTEASYTVTAHSTQGQEYWYRVKSVGANDNAKVSDLSAVYAKLVTMVITATTAPSSITVDNVTTLSAKTGTQHTLAWSGAAAGTNNAITGYQILYSTAPSTGFTELADVAANVSSYTVTAPVDANVTYYYRIITKGTYLDSGQSDYCSMTSYAIGQTSTPSNVRLSVTVAIPGTAVTLSWEKSTPGLNATITGYAVYRSTAAATGYTVLGTVDENTASMTVMPAEAEGGTYYFKVKAVCDDSDADSALSDYAALHTNISPTAPVVQSGSVSHCSRPRIMLTVGTDPEGELMTMSANGYTPSRSSGIASGDHILLRRNNARTSAGKDTFDITITDPNGGTVTQAAEVRYTPIVWTDEVVEAGTTIIKAAHITELQAAIDDMCSYYNVTARTWTPCVAGSTSTLMWYAHVTEIIQAIQAVADAVNAWDANATVNNVGLPTLEPTLMPTADVIMQMRAAVALL